MEQKDYWNSVSETKQFTTPFQANEFANYLEIHLVSCLKNAGNP